MEFKLHTKTTLFSSVIIVAMLVAALAITSAAIANIERSDDKTLAEIQAKALAQHITDIGSHDTDTVTRAANLIGSHPTSSASALVPPDNSWRRRQRMAAPRDTSSEETRNALLVDLAQASPADAFPSSGSRMRFAVTLENGRPMACRRKIAAFDTSGQSHFGTCHVRLSLLRLYSSC
jgi:hypothetical protein